MDIFTDNNGHSIEVGAPVFTEEFAEPHIRFGWCDDCGHNVTYVRENSKAWTDKHSNVLKVEQERGRITIFLAHDYDQESAMFFATRSQAIELHKWLGEHLEAQNDGRD